MLTPDFLRRAYDAGLTFMDYLATGTADQQSHWQRVYDGVHLSTEQTDLVQRFTRELYVLGLSGIWCGDCVQQGPLLQRIAEANPDRVHLRWLDRDEHASLQQQVRICGGNRVPVFLFCAEDFELLGWYGDRTLARYRAVAARQLGASCPLPGAPVDATEQASTLHEWLNEVERFHLMARISPRLRQKHGD